MKILYVLALLTTFFVLPIETKAQNPCQPSLTVTAVPDTYGCYSFTASNAGTPIANSYYSWNFGDGATAIGNNLLHCYSPGTVSVNYVITVTYNSPALCGSVPTQQSYTLPVGPPPPNSCVRSVPSISLTVNSVTVWTGVIIPETVFSYNFGDGTGQGNSNIHQYDSCGSYIIEVKDWDMNFPQQVCSAYVAVNIACPASFTTAIRKESNHAGVIRLFPNPCTDMINIQSAVLIRSVKIVDVLGRLWLSQKGLNAGQAALSVTEFPPGAYFLKLMTDGGAESNLKFIKE